MADKLKIKPVDGTDFKEIEITTKNWNLETRRKVNSLFRKGYLEKSDYTQFDSFCDVLLLTTTLTEDEIFKLSKDEIEVIGARIGEEMNKKK